jgi:hypothetical protein
MNEFEQARIAFLSQLTDDEKRRFSTVAHSEHLLRELDQLGQFANNKVKWTKLCNGVKRCSDKLNPYFAIVSITVQSHPEIASIVWGAFRLVLLVSPLRP